MTIKNKLIKVGNIEVGAGTQITIQSMCNTDTENTKETLLQINRCADLGCQIIRVSIPTLAAAEALKTIVAQSPIPVIADIHFDYKLALAAIRNGAHAIRINPGNIAQANGHNRIKEIADCAKKHQIPIRVGVNSGSLEPHLMKKYGKHSIEAIVESAFNQCELLESFGFNDIKVSLKSSTVKETIDANKLFFERSQVRFQETGKLPYPLHIGVTETGVPSDGIIKSAVGIGALLLAGIGDTIRVSLTAPPEEEVKVGLRILEACGLRTPKVEVISCPGCARNSNMNIEALTLEVKALISTMTFTRNIKLAVMGCMVNGPGEAKDADLGLAGHDQTVTIFSFGKVLKSVPRSEALNEIKQILITLQR